jgi:hypothetical protein
MWPGEASPFGRKRILAGSAIKNWNACGNFQFGRTDPTAVRKESRRQQRQESHARMLEKENIRLKGDIQLEMSFGSEVKILFCSLMSFFPSI